MTAKTPPCSGRSKHMLLTKPPFLKQNIFLPYLCFEGKYPRQEDLKIDGVGRRVTLKRWVKLTLYVQNGTLEIDNNPIENAIRPVAVGRKNYLFAGSHESAQRAAVAYTLLAACKTAGINPAEYLADVLQTLPGRNVNDIDDLIPLHWAAQKRPAEGEG